MGGNCLGVIISAQIFYGASFGSNCPGGNYWGGNFSRDNYTHGNYPRGRLSGEQFSD